MPMIRINQFHAREGEGEELVHQLRLATRSLAETPGCLSHEVLRSIDDGDLVVVLERWRSIEDHAAAVQAIDRTAFDSVMALLAGRPEGTSFRVAED